MFGFTSGGETLELFVLLEQAMAAIAKTENRHDFFIFYPSSCDLVRSNQLGKFLTSTKKVSHVAAMEKGSGGLEKGA
jgi:hypothetical protein